MTPEEISKRTIAELKAEIATLKTQLQDSRELMAEHMAAEEIAYRRDREIMRMRHMFVEEYKYRRDVQHQLKEALEKLAQKPDDT